MEKVADDFKLEFMASFGEYVQVENICNIFVCVKFKMLLSHCLLHFLTDCELKEKLINEKSQSVMEE